MKSLFKTSILASIFMFCLGTTGFAVNSVKNVTNSQLEFSTMTVDNLLNMSPRQYKEITGERLGIKNTVKMKVAQKILKNKLKNNSQEPLDKTLYIILAILGWGFLGMGMATDWDGSEWIICLVLTALCWLPGVIYALAKMKDHY